MSTRSLTRVAEAGSQIINMYRQSDGYPSGHGAELAAFLSGIRLTNGISRDTTKTANGAGCLAAQIVAHFKTKVGGIYLEPTSATDCGQEYEYLIDVVEGVITMYVKEGRNVVFSGTVENFADFCKEEHHA